jgi:hypothetical protein
MNEYFQTNEMPVTWEALEEINNKVMESSYKLLQMNLNGKNSLTKPFLETFTNKIYQYEETDDGKKKLVGGLFNCYRLDNSKQMKVFNKKHLNKLWKKNIVDIYFNGNENLNNANREIDANFKNSFDWLKKSYEICSFNGIEPEKTEAFNEWNEEKDIVNVVKRENNLSEEAKSRFENEKKDLEVQAKTERLIKEKEDADNTDIMSMKEILSIIKKIEARLDNVQPPSTDGYLDIINTVVKVAETIVLPVLLKFI